MKRLPLTMACGPYDRMEALWQGAVQPEGIDLRYLPIQSPPEIFARMIKTHSFDVAEMSLAHYCIMRTRGDFPFVAMPIFPSRVFRHGYLFISKSSGIKEPKDLEGKRVGVQEYRQTAGVWVRGILQHEYGVNLDTIHWVEGGVNEPRAPDHDMDLRPVRPISLELIPSDRTLNDMLEAGEIDAYFGARRPAALDKGKNVARLSRTGKGLLSPHEVPSHHAYAGDPRGSLQAAAMGARKPLQGLSGGEGLGLEADAVLRRPALHAALALR